MNVKTLRGTTWSHDRGLLPLLASSEAYARINPNIEVVWEPRSLQDFADYPVSDLAKRYDLIVFDHPFVGSASQGLLTPLDDLIGQEQLDQLRIDFIGPTFESYSWAGSQWGVPIDASCQTSAARLDLLGMSRRDLPTTWMEVFELAEDLFRRGKFIGLPLYPVDSLNTLLSLSAQMGGTPFVDFAQFVNRDIGLEALELLRELITFTQPHACAMNPIDLLELMSKNDEIPYCPAVFAYVNYSSSGICGGVTYASMPSASQSKSLAGRGILGGAGIGISAVSGSQSEAARFIEYLSSGTIQAGVYSDFSGQPAHQQAWDRVAATERPFYQEVKAAMDDAYLRPRFSGFVPLHSACAKALHAGLFGDRTKNSNRILDDLDQLCAEWYKDEYRR